MCQRNRRTLRKFRRKHVPTRYAGTSHEECLGKKFFLVVGMAGALALGSLAWIHSTVMIAVSLFVFGLSFILVQSTLIATAQEKLPQLRGTVMSLASFNMVTGAATGILVNGQVLNYGIEKIYLVPCILFLTVGILAYATISQKKELRETVAETVG